MSVEVTILGAEQLRAAARDLRAASREMDRALVAGIRRAVAPLGAQIKAGVGAYTPSGYTPVLAGSLKTTTSVRRTRLPGVSLKVSASGRRQNRDVAAVDAGILRHKTWGHLPWHAQHVRAGFVRDPFERMAGPVLQEMARAAGEVLDKVGR